MILEALQHLFTPAPAEVRALGYLRETIAIEARFRRCRADWAGHLEQCKDIIRQSVSELAPGSTILIIGSGSLHDVPLDEILNQNHHVILLDILHPPKIRRKYGTHPRITILSRDVTGLARPLYDGGGITKTLIKDAAPALPEADLVISLNLLSQLPINLVAYARKRHLPLPAHFAQDVMTTHLSQLSHAAENCLLICDLERQYLAENRVKERENALPDPLSRKLGPPDQCWDWHLSPKGELDPHITLQHRVACWLFRSDSVIFASG